MLSRFHRIPARNGQTDGQTDLLYQYHASVCWRAIKIANICLFDQLLVKSDKQYTVDGAVVDRTSVSVYAQTTTHQWILFITDPTAWPTTPKRTEHNLIVYIGKSEAEVTNNRRLLSRYCTVEANYWQTRSIARSLCDTRATCLFSSNGTGAVNTTISWSNLW